MTFVFGSILCVLVIINEKISRRKACEEGREYDAMILRVESIILGIASIFEIAFADASLVNIIGTIIFFLLAGNSLYRAQQQLADNEWLKFAGLVIRSVVFFVFGIYQIILCIVA